MIEPQKELQKEPQVVITARVGAEDKRLAGEILESLGINFSTAINMFLKQIVIQKGMPFVVTTTPFYPGNPEYETLVREVLNPPYTIEDIENFNECKDCAASVIMRCTAHPR